MAGRLTGRTALVTGGTRGIGEAIAVALAREGARTIVASRKPEGVASAVERIRAASGGEVHGVPLHVGEPARILEVVEAITDEHGLVDVLVNNAAANPHFGPMFTIDQGAFDKTFQVNVWGPLVLTREVARRLMDAGRPGSIVNISSVLGMRSAPLQGVYGMTKAAILSMTQTLAVELGPARIRVNAIAPGLVATKFAATLTDSPELRRMFEERTAWGQIAKPEDIAGAALWLASDESSYVTGQTIPVDAGFTIR